VCLGGCRLLGHAFAPVLMVIPFRADGCKLGEYYGGWLPRRCRAAVWPGSLDMAGGAGGQPSRGIHPDGKRRLPRSYYNVPTPHHL